ncbi:DUF2252 domain-containing protein [Stenomitos frigidus]|uniref:DUF2252 domain-containing protein n=1 Tax=Stenomitos frigidus ULC18 TaxID=2107698 RepID=A0A2T1E1T7_9CYAN|nr:DUF2252 domain-containing protein [Stenomitos frigidus]PSB26584.1 DUF2252 domain-containing protein [Stenomitos frigidus ULC18]
MATVVERIQQFNHNRKPELLALKYRTMRQDAFAFLRGTCHLFYEDFPTHSPLNAAPPVWLCGDLHLENFGSYKGNDRLVYFDINDFDEAVLAPCTWDLARFITSILVASDSLTIDATDAQALCQNALTAYTRVLAKGQVGMVNRDTATGLVKELLDSLKQRKRKDFLEKRTEKVGKTRQLLLHEKARAIAQTQRDKIAALLETWAAKQKKPKFFRLLDAAYRVAGTGSLGLERYILLVEGDGSPNNNYLLDLKTGSPSSLQPYVTLPQPQWANQAERIVTVQQRVQWAPPALLDTVELDSQAYVLRELQPMDDAVNLSQWNGKLRRLRKVIETMAEVTAWGQLLSGGRQGSAIADDLITFAQTSDWHQPLLHYAQTYATQVEADYQTFCQAKLEGNGE